MERYFNPRAPRGARRNRCARGRSQNIFQSTCPARGTTSSASFPAPPLVISIHVPREGHDRKLAIVGYLLELFQSTCPARGTTTTRPYLWPCLLYTSDAADE